MPYFAKDVLSGDQSGLDRLHRILHGCTAEERQTGEAKAPLPTLKERFGSQPQPPSEPSREATVMVENPRS